MLKFILPSILIFLLSSQVFAQLEVQPHLHFKKLKTAHFDIIYNAQQQDLGILYAEKLEKARLLLGNYFSVLPEKTVVIINDKTDVTNGYATRIPYPHIMTYPVLPGPTESLADTGDWTFELLAHEYTHILTFEPATGFMRVVRGIFGNVASANLLLPTWWKEGLAVQMETRLSNGGRLRSIYQDAAIRAFVEDKKLADFSLAEVNEFLPTWPEGMRPYLFGSLMWSEMTSEKGDAVIDKLNLRQSGRVPYAIEAPAEDSLGRRYSQEFTKTLEDVESKATQQITSLRKVAPTVFQELKLKNMYASGPAINDDGSRLVVITASETGQRELKVLKRNPQSHSFVDGLVLKTADDLQETNPAPTILDGPPSGSIQRVSWFHNNIQFVYDKVDVVNRIERYSDLYLYDTKTQKSQNLTHELRAREPAVSPDDQKIVFVKLSGGKTQLGLLTLNNHEIDLLFSADLQERISYPTFLNDHEILFSLRKTNRSEWLYKYNLLDRKVSTVLSNYPDVRFTSLQKTPQGSFIYFTSSKNGTHNVYRADLNFKNIRPVSHTLTALFSPALDPVSGDLYTTQLTSAGPKVVAFASQASLATPSELPVIAPLLADRYSPQATTETTPEDLKKTYEISDYSSGSYLWPQYWIPFLASSSSSSGVVFEAMTSGFDPLKKHSYTLLGAWDTGLNRGSIQGTYLNQQTSLPVLVSLYQRNSYLVTYDNKLTDTGGSLSVLPDTFKLSRYSSLLVGGQYVERTTTTSSVKRLGPYTELNYADYVRAGQEISPESGFGGYLGAANFVAQPGYLDHSQFKAGGTAYLSSFLPARHAIMLKVNGVYTTQKIPAINGVQTDSQNVLPDSTVPFYLLRGYKTGQLFGRNLINTNLEYRFPIRQIYRGSGTDPFFFHRLTGALVTDAAAVDGYFLNDRENVYELTSLKRQFVSYGAEVKLETTMGYLFPITFVFGYYYAPNAPGGGAGTLGSSLLIGGM